MAPFSNYGSCVDVVAPGTNIASALTSVLATDNINKAGKKDVYTTMSGPGLC